MKRSLLTVIMLLGLFEGRAAAADSGWVGVWRMVWEGTGSEEVFVVVSKAPSGLDASVYTTAWEKQGVRLKSVDERKLVFDTQPRARTYRFQLEMQGPGKAQGGWEFVHPQYKYRGSARAERLLSADQWDPMNSLRALEDPEHVIDLNSILLKAPLKSLEEFVRFWEAQIEPKFFVLIEDVLYRNRATGGTKASLLKPTYELLKKRSYQDLSSRTAREMREIVAAVKAQQPLLYRPVPIVLMPSLGSLEASSKFFNKRLYVRLGVDLVAERHTGKEFRAFLAARQFKLPLYQMVSPDDTRLGVELIREGLANYLAVATGMVANADTCLGLSPGTYKANVDKLGSYKQRLLADLEKRDPNEVKRYLLGIDAPGSKKGLIAAYRFGEQVGSRFKPEELLGMGAPRLVELLRAYLKEGDTPLSGS